MVHKKLIWISETVDVGTNTFLGDIRVTFGEDISISFRDISSEEYAAYLFSVGQHVGFVPLLAYVPSVRNTAKMFTPVYKLCAKNLDLSSQSMSTRLRILTEIATSIANSPGRKTGRVILKDISSEFVKFGCTGKTIAHILASQKNIIVPSAGKKHTRPVEDKNKASLWYKRINSKLFGVLPLVQSPETILPPGAAADTIFPVGEFTTTFSFGVLMWELYFGVPATSKTHSDLETSIQKEFTSKSDHDGNGVREYFDLMSKCLSWSSKWSSTVPHKNMADLVWNIMTNRPDFDEILKHLSEIQDDLE